MLTAGTVAAVAVALGAFALLKPSEEDKMDAFTRAADKICVDGKRQIAAIEARAVHEDSTNVVAFARALLVAVEEWRLDQGLSNAPPTHASNADALDSALLDLLIWTGALARVAAHGGPPPNLAAAARRVELATKRVDRAAEVLGLQRCVDFSVGATALGTS